MINSFNGEYSWLSNFYERAFQYNNVYYPTAEHAFQAAKTTNPMEANIIRHAATASQAKREGRRCTIRADWEDVKLGVMFEILTAKFSDQELMAKLLATGEQALIEGNNWNDSYWGVCNGKGENHLGKLLMRLRSEFQNNEGEK